MLRSSEELKKLVEMCPCVPDGIGIWKCWFLKRGETGVPGEKPLGARERTHNKFNPHMASTPGFEPRSHWWEANALTTAPLLLPKRGNGSCFKTVFLKAKKRLRWWGGKMDLSPAFRFPTSTWISRPFLFSYDFSECSTNTTATRTLSPNCTFQKGFFVSERHFPNRIPSTVGETSREFPESRVVRFKAIFPA